MATGKFIEYDTEWNIWVKNNNFLVHVTMSNCIIIKKHLNLCFFRSYVISYVCIDENEIRIYDSSVPKLSVIVLVLKCNLATTWKNFQLA